MAFVHNFRQSMEVGKRGEEHIIEYLNNSDNVKKIVDVRDIREYQKMDVDFLVTFADGIERKIEVKTDTYKSGNIYYEVISSEESDTLGCFEKTEADYLFYYFVNWGYLYILGMGEYRKWFQEKQELFNDAGYKKRVRNSAGKNKTYTSIGYAYPVSILEEENHDWLRKITMK